MPALEGEIVDAEHARDAHGFDEIALIQIGGDHQGPFLDWSQKALLPALRDAL